jgi:hypothetical protein
MALNPGVLYAPNNITPPNANYPHGEAKNVTAPNAGDGTPWDINTTSDLFGFQQKLLTEAGITPSGAPDNAINSQYFDAMQALFGAQESNILIASNFSQNPFQRGDAFTIGAGVGVAYPADRVRAQNLLATGSFQTSVITTGGPTVAQAGVLTKKGVRFTVDTAQAVIGAAESALIAFDIEGYDFVNIAQQAFTQEIWVTSSITAVYCFAFANNAPADRSYVTEVQLQAGVLTKVDLIIPATPGAGNWNYDNELGLSCNISLAQGVNFDTGSPDSWQAGLFLSTVNQVNFFANIGTTLDIWLPRVTPGQLITRPSYESMETVLAKCQRYFQKSYARGVNPGANTFEGVITAFRTVADAIDFVELETQLSTEMRRAPAMTFYSGTGAINSIREFSGGGSDIAVIAGGQDVGSKRTGKPVATAPVNILVGTRLDCHYTANSEIIV